MRGLRSTIALLVVLLGLGAYIYFVTSKQPEGTAETPRERVFAELSGDTIDEITVKSGEGETTTLKKTEGAWQMTAPAPLKADASELASMTSSLGSLEIARVVDENPADVKDYGLDPPLVEIAFKASGDKTYAGEHRLFLGSKSPTGGDVFARRDGDKRVLMVPGHLEPIFNRSTFNLRDKTLMVFDREKIDRITVSSAGKTLEFAKEGMNWTISKPIAAPADSTAVDAIIGRLMTTQMKSIVTEQATAAELTKYGFGRPQATTTLTGGGATTFLIIGGSATDSEVYARDGSKPLVATVEAALLKDFQKDAAEYRRREIFAARGFSTDRLEFTRDGQTTVFERVQTAGQPDKWRRLSPTAGDPDAMQIDDLLTRLESLRAEEFVDSPAPTGLDKPSLTVYAKFDQGKEERVSFAKTDTTVYATVPGQPGAVTVPSAAFDEAIKALDLVSK